MTFLRQAVPVIWLSQLAIWPQLLAQFLLMVRCIPVTEDAQDEAASRTAVVQRLVAHPNWVCWKDENHNIVGWTAVAGLLIWCLGVPLMLYLSIWRVEDLQDSENYRCYGYFVQGFQKNFWYWDIVVKRADTCVMLVVAYTSLTGTEEMKLLIFPIISGLFLALSTWYKPYLNAQAGILDLVEYVLLGSRFLLFSVVALLLIVFPGKVSVELCAFLLVLMMGAVIDSWEKPGKPVAQYCGLLRITSGLLWGIMVCWLRQPGFPGKKGWSQKAKFPFGRARVDEDPRAYIIPRKNMPCELWSKLIM